MKVTVYTDPIGTVAAHVSHPDFTPNYSDGTAQVARHRAIMALAAHLGESPLVVRPRVHVAEAGITSTIYALSN